MIILNQHVVISQSHFLIRPAHVNNKLIAPIVQHHSHFRILLWTIGFAHQIKTAVPALPTNKSFTTNGIFLLLKIQFGKARSQTPPTNGIVNMLSVQTKHWFSRQTIAGLCSLLNRMGSMAMSLLLRSFMESSRTILITKQVTSQWYTQHSMAQLSICLQHMIFLYISNQLLKTKGLWVKWDNFQFKLSW